MLTFKSLIGARTAKASLENAIIATTTKGDFKITKSMQAALGLKDGDFVSVVEGENGEVYIGKGVNGTVQFDDNGQEEKDARGRVIYLEGQEGYGSVIRKASENSDNLKMTNASAWLTLGCTGEENIYFKVGEGVEAQVPMNDKGDMHQTTFFQLEEYKRVAKSTSGKADEDGIEVEEEEIETAIADNDFEEEEI
jgi:hypothetical protein